MPELRFSFVATARLPEDSPLLGSEQLGNELLGPDGVRLRTELQFIKPGKAPAFLRCELTLLVETRVRHERVAEWMLRLVPPEITHLDFESVRLPRRSIGGAIGVRTKDLPEGRWSDPPDD